MNCKWVSKEDKRIKCERHADSSGYCIFHKKNKSKRENILFLAYIKKGKINDFTGFVFEDEFDINKVINYSYNKLLFNEAIFEKKAIFEKYTFEKNVDFSNAHFNSIVSFKRANFFENCIIINSVFNIKYINERVFDEANFSGQKLIVENSINFPRLDGVIFSPYTKFILRDVYYDKNNAICGKTNYRIARIQAKQIENQENIGYYYYNERNYASKFLEEEKFNSYKEYLSVKFFDFLSKNIIGYGEKPFKLLIISFSIISIFAFLYMLIGVNSSQYGLIKLNLLNNSYSFYELCLMYIDVWYFSIITFCTVGYGDMLIIGILGKLLVCIEVFLGVTINAIWTSILLSRMVR